MKIQQHDDGVTGVFFIENEHGERVAKMTYQYHEKKAIAIDHTFVDDSLRGQGVAKQLFDAGVIFAREQQLKIIPLCSYAVSMFERYPDLADIRA